MEIITIAITVCMAGIKLEETLQSILGQTLKEVEILCIISHPADCDAFATKYASCGSRLKFAKVQDAKSMMQVAKAISSSASGAYVLFLREGDVFRHKNSCRQLVRTLRRKKTDILHYNVEMTAYQSSSLSQCDWKTHQKPLFKRRIKEDILAGCFEKKQFGWSMHDKVFKLALIHKALHNVDELCGTVGDEAAVFFILASVADIYTGIKAQYTVNDTNYSTGRDEPSSCANATSADEFVQMVEVSLIKNHSFNKHRTSFDSFRLWMLQTELRRWFQVTDRHEGYEIFRRICEVWEIMVVLSEVARIYWQQPDQVADRLKHIPIWRPREKKIRTIGTFYYRIGNGGLERVLTTLVTLWTAVGYRVVLFLDDRSDGDEYALPEGVERVVLPDTFKMSESTIISRMQAWQNALREYDIDIVIGHAWISPILIWDIMSVKAMHIPYVQYTHGAFSCLLMEKENQDNFYFAQLTHVYGLCDCVVTLSSVNQTFWQCFCDRVYMICNPTHLDMEAILPAKLETLDIVWVGRISPEKRPIDAVRIMRLVANVVPEAKLHIVGKAEKQLAYLEDELRSEIYKMHLNENVILEGFHQHTDAYYQNASIYLSTSAYEGFPMALMESKIFGLPCVMYDLPYLEVSRDPAGMYVVPQGSIKEAAELLIHLLIKPDMRRCKGLEARESARKYSNTAVIQSWISLLKDMENPAVVTRQDNDIDIMLKTIMEHLRLGSENRLRQSADFRRKSSFILIRKSRSLLYCYREQGWRGVWGLILIKLHAVVKRLT